MTVQEAGRIMDVLKTAYPAFYARQTDAERAEAVKLWAAMFADYPLRIVGGAVKAFVATDDRGYPPGIGAIMAKCREITEPEELGEGEAWALVTRALRNSIYGSREEFDKLPAEVRAIVHAPEQLKAWAMDGDFNEAVESSNFKRAFRARQQKQREFRALPRDVQKLAISVGARMALPE